MGGTWLLEHGKNILWKWFSLHPLYTEAQIQGIALKVRSKVRYNTARYRHCGKNGHTAWATGGDDHKVLNLCWHVR
jgi:hypothetical protein